VVYLEESLIGLMVAVGGVVQNWESNAVAVDVVQRRLMKFGGGRGEFE
jgi:hypothetical protein